MSAVILVHGMGTALETPFWPPITEGEAAGVIERFPAAGRFLRLLWHSPRPFSAAALADTRRGCLFLKRHHISLRTPATLSPEHAFIAHLAAAGLDVPRLLRTAAGETALVRGDWTWEVHHAAPGADLYRERLSWTPFLGTRHAEAAGRALARLHRAASGFHAPSRSRSPLVASFGILRAPDPLAAAHAYVAARPALRSYLAEKPWQSELARIFAAHDAAALAPALAALPPLWTHGDWHPSNMTWTSDGEVAHVLDFGLADRTAALHDLALALERSAVRWLDFGTDEHGTVVDAGAAEALLSGYAAEAPLRPVDRFLLARLLPLVHVEFALSEIAYFQGLSERADQADLAWHRYLIGHADWFSTEDGRRLLSLAAGTAPAARN